MSYLVFNSSNEAYIANAIISFNMNLSKDTTMKWGEIQQRLDNKFVLPKPELQYMNLVSAYTEEEYNSNWFNQEV